MAHTVQSGQLFVSNDLPGLCVLALLYFQAAYRAVVQPCTGDRGHHPRGVPGCDPDHALQCCNGLRRRCDETYA